MQTRCRFICTSIKKYQHWDRAKGLLFEAEFSVVTGGSPENDAFFAATPSGDLKLGSFVPDRFEVGKEYYIDIIEGSSPA